MPFNEFSAQIEAQPCSTDTGDAHILATDKPSKEMCLLGTWNSHSLITDTETGFVWLRVFLKRYLDEATTWTVLDRIGKQIRKALFDPDGIDRCLELGKRSLERELMPVGGRLEPFGHLPGESNQIGQALFQLELACLHPCHIQQIFREAG
jgi:hypothetical protein